MNRKRKPDTATLCVIYEAAKQTDGCGEDKHKKRVYERLYQEAVDPSHPLHSKWRPEVERLEEVLHERRVKHGIKASYPRDLCNLRRLCELTIELAVDNAWGYIFGTPCVYCGVLLSNKQHASMNLGVHPWSEPFTRPLGFEFHKGMQYSTYPAPRCASCANTEKAIVKALAECDELVEKLTRGQEPTQCNGGVNAKERGSFPESAPHNGDTADHEGPSGCAHRELWGSESGEDRGIRRTG